MSDENNTTNFEEEKRSSDASQQDMILWKQWNRTKNPQDLANLLRHTEGIRRNVVNSWKSTVSPVTMNSDALRHSVDAFKKFDPTRGVKLSTHLTNHLQKISRTVYEESSFLSIPENRTLKRTTYTQAEDDLRERYGRDPSAEELSDELGWPVREVERFQRESRQLLVASEPIPVGMEGHCSDQGIDPNHKLHYVLADMPGSDQQIFRYSTGYGDTPILDSKEIQKRMNIKQSQLSYRKRVIAEKLNASLPGHNTINMLGGC